jgi:hypothetical protein
VRPARGLPRRIGRTLEAVDLTLDDVLVALSIGATRGGGLRGGSFALGRHGIVLRGFSFVAGVAVDARPVARRRLRMRVHGAEAARGTLVLGPRGRFRGTIGGKPVHGRLSGGAPGA